MGFPRWAHLWKSVEYSQQHYDVSLDLLLQGSHWVGFHNGLCWLGLDLHLLAKHDPHARFSGWLRPGLEAAKSWNGEHPSLLHFLSCDGHKAVDHIGASLLLEAVLSRKRLGHGTLCHGLATSLHGLHGRKHGAERSDKSRGKDVVN
jgi:hypothetical protein